jgi:hypothetical protein
MNSKGKEPKMKRKDTGRRSRSGILLGSALALTLGALVLAGCGGSSGGGSTETSTTASSSSSGTASSAGESGTQSGGPVGFDISEEQKACLKEKGIELPEFKSGQPPGGADGEMPSPPAGGQLPEGGEAPEGGETSKGGPPTGGLGEGNEEMTKAFEECGVETPEFKGGPGEGGPGGTGGPNVNSAAFKKQVKEYVACVRKHGYELAEPNFSGAGPIFEKSESESAAFKKASEQCQGLLGGPQTSISEGSSEES